MRISDYLLFELAYSELFFVDKFWPELTTDDIDKIIKNYGESEHIMAGVIRNKSAKREQICRAILNLKNMNPYYISDDESENIINKFKTNSDSDMPSKYSYVLSLANNFLKLARLNFAW